MFKCTNFKNKWCCDSLAGLWRVVNSKYWHHRNSTECLLLAADCFLLFKYHSYSCAVLIHWQPLYIQAIKTCIKATERLTRYPNWMVESRAWMTDHKPQKKWDARENLRSETHKALVVNHVWPVSGDLRCSASALTCSPQCRSPLWVSPGRPRSGRQTLDRFRASSFQWSEATVRGDMTNGPQSAVNEYYSILRFHTHLLGLWGVGLSVYFEVRELITAVVVHPFTEMVANIKTPAKWPKDKHTSNLLNKYAFYFIVFTSGSDQA